MAQLDSRPSIVVVDHSLRSFEGHHFEYSLASAKALAQQGASVVVSCHKDFGQKLIDGIRFQPDFSVSWTESSRFEKLRLWLQIVLRTVLGKAAPRYVGRFGVELEKVLLARGREIFIHTLSFTQLVEVCEVIAEQGSPVKIHTVLRYDPGHEGSLKNHLLKMLFRLIRRQEFPLQFYSDTPELCEGLTQRFGMTVKQLPILFESLRVTLDHQTPVKVSYLGDAREEKGFQHLPKIISQVLSRASDVQFLIQLHLSKANESHAELRRAAEEIRKLAARTPDRVVILPGALGPQEYRDLVEKSDVVLLPYDKTAYRWRSSGILVQGAAAGKVVIVPRGTSMETMVGRDPAVTFSSADEIPEKLIAICQNWALFHNKALVAAKSWQEQHSPESFARQILGSPL